ncbi:MAG: TIGR04076 family protein [Candidatus Bathyarchaeota archaeon]
MRELHKVKITVLKRFHPSEVFVNSLVTPVHKHFEACGLYRDCQEFIVEDLRMPEDFCNSAWVSMYGNIQLLSFGGDLPWFKEKGIAVNCCIDGLRPVIFKLERI